MADETTIAEWLAESDVPTETLAAKLASMAGNELSGPRLFGKAAKGKPANDRTGRSTGYHGQGKAQTSDGQRWQCSVQAILVNSKNDASLTATADLATLAAKIGTMIQSDAMARTFSTGKVGIYCQGKVTCDGQRYQVQAQAVHVLDPATKSA